MDGTGYLIGCDTPGCNSVCIRAFSCIVGDMQQMLSRTVTVGKKYALHVWTGFLFILSGLLSLFILAAAYDWQSFVLVGCIIIIWCLAGILVSLYALSKIQNSAEQIRSDLKRILNETYGRLRRE